MPERNVIELVDEAVEAILGGRTPQNVDPEVAMLAAIATDLRDLPDPAFKATLRKRLVPEEEQTMIPYLVVNGADKLIAFVTEAFGGTLNMRVAQPDGRVMHAEMTIGDSKIEIGEPSDIMNLRPAAIHLYVGNADEVFDRAVRAGGEVVRPMQDQFYGDREGTIRDPLGNQWYIATHVATGARPEGFRTITPFLHVHGTDKLIDWVERAFGAEEIDRYVGDDGLIWHSALRIGNSLIEMGEHAGEWKPVTMHIHLYVDDADVTYQRAIDAGGHVTYPINDAPYGERVGGVEDPFGNTWYIATKL